jgi:Polyketide cyclase / dehydrase and lipid transport
LTGSCNVHVGRPSAGARLLARGGLLLLLAAAGARGARAADVAVEVDEADGAYRVRGAFIVAAPRDVVWSVLTDYAKIGKFVSSVRSSTVERQCCGRSVVTQSAVGGFFPFRRTMHVVLDVRETGGTRITFRDLAKHDFRRYSGQWVIARDSAVTSVAYALDALPRAAMPHALGRGVLSRSARDLLTQVRDEMVRRTLVAAKPAERASPVR